MAGKNTAAFGIYETQADVEYALDALRAEGFRNTDISVLFPENKGTKDFAVEKNTKAPEGTAAGATTGAVIGGTLGWLAGIGALAIPGIGPLLAAGPIVAALTGVGVAMEESLVPWWEWVFQNTKPSVTKAASRAEAYCSPYIATIRTGPRKPRTFWCGLAQRMCRRPARPRRTSRRLINPCHAPVNVPTRGRADCPR